MRADAELFKDKIEVSLDGRQVFYLFFGGAVIASLVFVLGVMVGKRVEARTAVGSVALASAADDPLSALDRLSQGEGESRSFRSALIDGDEDPRYAVDIALAAQDARPSGGHGDDDKAARANNADKADEADVPEPLVEAEKQAKAAAHKAEEEAQAKADKPAARPDKEKASAAESDDDANVEVDDDAAHDANDEADANGPARFTLQLSSFRDRVEADSFFDKLVAAGYEPYIVEAEVPDKGLWYRVRLGGYPSYDAALEAKKAFEDSQHIIAYVTRIN